jgi:hypothetical protein
LISKFKTENVYAESLPNGSFKGDQMVGFIRFGNDFTQTCKSKFHESDPAFPHRLLQNCSALSAEEAARKKMRFCHWHY